MKKISENIGGKAENCFLGRGGTSLSQKADFMALISPKGEVLYKGDYDKEEYEKIFATREVLNEEFPLEHTKKRTGYLDNEANRYIDTVRVEVNEKCFVPNHVDLEKEMLNRKYLTIKAVCDVLDGNARKAIWINGAIKTPENIPEAAVQMLEEFGDKLAAIELDEGDIPIEMAMWGDKGKIALEIQAVA